MCCCTRNDPTCTLGVACSHVAKPLRAMPCELNGRHFPGGSLEDWNNFVRALSREVYGGDGHEGVLQIPL